MYLFSCFASAHRQLTGISNMHVQYWLTIVTGCLETLCFSGIVLGWPSLQYVLQKEGYFSYLCANTYNNVTMTSLATGDVDISCKKSQASFNLAFTVAMSLLHVLSFPIGYLLDRFGTWIFRTFVTIGYTSGLVLLAVSTPRLSVLVYPSLSLIGISGIGLFLSNFQIANLASSLRGVVLSILPGTLISSAVLFFLVKKGHDTGFNLNFIVWMLCIATCFLWIRTFALMPKEHIPHPIQESTTLKYGYKEWKCFKNPTIAEHFVPISLVAVAAPEEVAHQVMECCNHSTVKAEMSFKQCLQQHLYWTNCFHIAVMVFRVNFVAGILQVWLKNIVRRDEISKITDDFGIVLLFGALVSPINGIIFDAVVKLVHKNTENTKVINLKASMIILLLASIQGIILSIMVVAENPYGTFVFLLLTMSLVNGSNSIFVAVIFPPEHVGKLFGFQNVFIGLTILLQYALFQLALAVDPSFYYINIGLLGAVIITLLHPLFLYLEIRKLESSAHDIGKGLKSAIVYGSIFGIGLNPYMQIKEAAE